MEASDGFKKTCKIAGMMGNQAKGVVSPKYIEDICNRWKEYNERPLNEELSMNAGRTESPVNGPVEHLSIGEVQIAANKMKRNKAAGLYQTYRKI